MWILEVVSALIVTANAGEQPYKTIHQRKNDDSAHIQAQANEYFSGQFSNENDIVVMPLPSDDDDSKQDSY